MFRSSAIYLLTFNCNILFLFHGRFCFFLRNHHLQGAVFEFSLDILLGHCITNIEASAAGAGIALPADVGSAGILFIPGGICGCLLYTSRCV